MHPTKDEYKILQVLQLYVRVLYQRAIDHFLSKTLLLIYKFEHVP